MNTNLFHREIPSQIKCFFLFFIFSLTDHGVKLFVSIVTNSVTRPFIVFCTECTPIEGGPLAGVGSVNGDGYHPPKTCLTLTTKYLVYCLFFIVYLLICSLEVSGWIYSLDMPRSIVAGTLIYCLVCSDVQLLLAKVLVSGRSSTPLYLPIGIQWEEGGANRLRKCTNFPASCDYFGKI